MLFQPNQYTPDQLIKQIDIERYGATRNAIEGSVTHLSPYITHGICSLPYIVNQLKKQKGLHPAHKLYSEFAWREYYYHVWSHLGDEIFEDIKPRIPQIRYQSSLPADVLSAQTGLAPIDLAVRELYTNGYLHNHARMWLASYLIHFRKVDWKVAADWMYGYLIDGDLASNHLSWQWVGGTFSKKPYLFNAENVAKYAPVAWHCNLSVLDQSYEALEAVARSEEVLVEQTISRASSSLEIPALMSAPPPDLIQQYGVTTNLKAFEKSPRNKIHLVHPWSLNPDSSRGIPIGIIHLPFHAEYPWSRARWEFVLSRMQQVTEMIVMGDLQTILGGFLEQYPNLQLNLQATFHPGYAEVFEELAQLEDVVIEPIERFLPNPEEFYPSFSKFWQLVTSKEKLPKP